MTLYYGVIATTKKKKNYEMYVQEVGFDYAGLDPDPKSDRCIFTEISYYNFGNKNNQNRKNR